MEFLEEAIAMAPDNKTKENKKSRLAWLYSHGPQDIQNPEKARELYEKIGGERLANYLQGQAANFENSGDSEKARDLYLRAVELGSITAKTRLARNYLRHRETDADVEKGEALFREAALSDNRQSQYEAAEYFIEYGLDEDKPLGIWLR